LTLGAGTFACAAGCAGTSGPDGTWALGSGSLTSRAGDFLASPAGGAVATAFPAAAVGISGVSAGWTFAFGAGPASTLTAGATFLDVASGAAAAAAGTPHATAGSEAGGPFAARPAAGAWGPGASVVGGH
jgi:hypothetical protein